MLAAMFCARGTRGQKLCFGPRLPRNWGACPCVELVVRCPVASKGLAGRGGTRERSRFGCRVEQGPSIYLLPLALSPLASAFARRDASSWVSSCVREAAHTNFYPPTPPPGALEGVLVVLGGHTNHNRPRASLTKHSKDQCAYTWHVLVATQSVGRGKEQGSLKPVQRKHKRNSASLGPFASRRAKSGKEMRPECAGIDKGQRAWGPVLQGIFYKAI